MTISSITEFAESTAFERLVLDRLCPVFSNDESEVLDLREAMAGTGPTVIGLSFTRKLPQTVNKLKIETSISLEMRDEEVEIYGKPNCWNIG